MENGRQAVAIVDDDAGVRTALRELLRAMGYDAVSFGSAEEFLASGRQSDFDCLIADVDLPGNNGPGLLRVLAEGGNAIPALLITAHDDPVTLELIRAAGPVPHLRKPFGEDELINALRTLTPE